MHNRHSHHVAPKGAGAPRFFALVACALGLGVMLTAAPERAHAAETPEARHAGSGGGRTKSPTQPATDAFGVYYAVRVGSGFVVVGANGARVPCGEGHVSTACFASKIDLSPMGLSAAASRSVLSEVGSDPGAVKLLFAGNVAHGDLRVWQAWRAPEAVSTGVQLFNVSHPNEQSLVVNDWRAASLGTLDFASAPGAVSCYVVPGAVCEPTLDAPTVQVHTPAGIILAGVQEGRGAFRVDAYFLDLSVGVTQSGDGYSYCKADQFLCSNFVCSSVEGDCNGTHGRIRGLLDPPTLPVDPAFMQWQLATRQLTRQEVFGL